MLLFRLPSDVGMPAQLVARLVQEYEIGQVSNLGRYGSYQSVVAEIQVSQVGQVTLDLPCKLYQVGQVG